MTLVPDNSARAGIVNGAKSGVAPAVAPLLSLWPVQNGPDLGGGIAEAFSHPLQRIREDFGTTRLDYNISQQRHALRRLHRGRQRSPTRLPRIR